MFPNSNVYRPLVRLRPRHQRQAAARRHRPGRPEHRSPDDRLLRRPGSGEGGQSQALVEMLLVLGVNNSINTCHMDQKWLPQVKFLGLVHGAEDRRADRRVVSRASRASRWRPTCPTSNSGGHSAGARPPADQRRSDRFDDAGAFSSRARTTTRGSTSSTCASARSSVSPVRGRTSAWTSTTSLNSDVISGTATRGLRAHWLAPTTVVAPRLLKVSWTFDF